MLRHTVLCIFSVLLAFSSSAFAQDAPTGRTKVVGGERANVADWPGFAALRSRASSTREFTYFCGGSVIAERWVLTAAHCLHDYIDEEQRKPNGLEVIIGAGDIRLVDDNQIYTVDRVIIHPTYRAKANKALNGSDDGREQRLGKIALKYGNDIALLRLSRQTASPRMRLPNPSTHTSAGRNVRVAGFGYTEDTLAVGLKRFQHARSGDSLLSGSPVLLQASLLTISQEACAAHYPTDRIGPEQICAGLEFGGRDSCSGDSGGPLVEHNAKRQPYQIGLVSWGKVLCGSGKSYGVYTRVSRFIDWIISHTGELQIATGVSEQAIHAGQLTQDEVKLAINQLTTLQKSQRRVALGLSKGAKLRVGDEIQFRISSPVSGRLLLLDLNADGAVTLLYPNQFSLKARGAATIAADTDLKVPDPSYGFTAFRAQPPVGQGHVLAFILPEGFDLDRIGLSALLQQQILTRGFAPVSRPTGYFMQLINQIEAWLRQSRSTTDSRQIGIGIWPYVIEP